MSGRSFRDAPAFPLAAPTYIADPQLRANLRRATSTIRSKRNRLVEELTDFEALREAAEAVKTDALDHLDALLEQLEERVSAAGGTVHYATDAAEANRIIVDLVRQTGATEVVKVKSMTTAEIGLNEALARAGIDAAETDLAELIVQLGDDLPSHIVVPAIHRNRGEIREIFAEHMGERGLPAPAGLSAQPTELAAAARVHLRDRFLRAQVAISGANFAVAESGSLVVVESEGNGRMCLTLPETVISLVGIEKVIPRFADLEIFLQLLARSATGERMNPYTSIWSGVTPGDGPSNFHLVLLDNGRSAALADPVGRQALRCIRCAACLNVCPVYERVGGHAYGSVYPGPIGAVLTPQLNHVASDPVTASLPFASTLCGACFEVCPVRIDIPRLLVHLRTRVVEQHSGAGASLEAATMAAAGVVLDSPPLLRVAERIAGRIGALLAPGGTIRRLPGPLHGWTDSRVAPAPARQSFRDWWRDAHDATPGTENAPASRDHTPAAITAGLRRIAAALLPRRRHDPRPSLPAAPSPVSGGRAAVLGAVRTALADRPSSIVPTRTYRQAGASGIADPVAHFIERASEYRASVIAVGETDVARTVTDILVRAGAKRVTCPADLPAPWRPDPGPFSLEVDDGARGAGELDRFDAAVSGCAVAIAETGTIVLDGGARQGRRMLSLLPDHLVVVVDESEIVGGLPDGVARLKPPSPQTWISGPSATSDIELQRVEGVHGPRRLDVVVVHRVAPDAPQVLLGS